jgi:hypothetical protein
MANLTFTVSIPLTAAQIIRNRSSTIDAGPPTEDEKREALELAHEVHAVINEVQARFVRYRIGEPWDDESDSEPVSRWASDDEVAFTLADLLDAVRRGLLGFGQSTGTLRSMKPIGWRSS